ncbi:hypothetical protein CPB84DRAFT_1071798 [Gymnopilus junonius]|uniref:Uncharacterized protein n=1 Tax=Gymnopilus junonius TaxID=109634 RepID=A0A9P5NVU5_GYMJU|nr:hypothetical protein CPB84DRAFT_1071798 [Gymnopilus junonius]
MMLSTSLAVWSVLAAAFFAVQAVLLAVAPRLLLFLANAPDRALSPLEAFLATHFALALATLSLALLLNIPSTPSPLPSEQSHVTQPLLYPLALAGLVSALFAYNTTDVGSLATIFFLISLIIGLWGSWEILFANSASFSKTTGADKHTSAFIFGNKTAASSQKKQLKTK